MKDLFIDDITLRLSFRRVLAGFLSLILIAYCVDSLFIRRDFSEAIFGTLFAAIVTLLGIIAYTNLKSKKDGNTSGQDTKQQ